MNAPQAQGSTKHRPVFTQANWVLVIIIAIVLLMGATASAVVTWLTLTGKLPDIAAPLHYSQAVFAPSQSPVCAGDPLQFTVTSTIKSAPARVSTYFSIWDSDERRTIQSETGPTNNLIFLPQDIGRTIRSDIVFSDTAILAPGRYEYRRFAQALGREPETFYVPFEVIECKK